jgi:hypothetical protein
MAHLVHKPALRSHQLAALRSDVIRTWCVATMFTALIAGPLSAQSDDRANSTPAICSEQQSFCTETGEQIGVGSKNAPSAPTADATEHGQAEARGQSGKRMFGVLPNYSTVENATEIEPVSRGQKFTMASRNTFDLYVYPIVGLQATLNHTYGSGRSAYLKQYMTSLTDNMTGNFLTSAALPTILHQDPRYFERGSGRFVGRVGYAASRSLATRSDRGRPEFNFSEIGGNALAAGISNVYYPKADRTVSGSLSRWGMQVMWDTLSNELKEFWPDLRQKLHHQ